MKKINCQNVKMQLLKDLSLKMERKLSLAIIKIGENKVSNIYLNSIKKIFETYDVEIDVFSFSNDCKEKEILSLIDELNSDLKVNGIMLLLPILADVDVKKLQNKIDFRKDIEGITQENYYQLQRGNGKIVSPVAKGVIDIINFYKIDVYLKKVTIISRSTLIGKPLSYLFEFRGANVNVCHSRTKNIKDILSNSDLIVTATGKRDVVLSSFVKDDSVIIDVGTEVLEDKIISDLDENSFLNTNCLISNSPGGVGLLTTVNLLYNLGICYDLQFNNKKDN